MFDALLDLLHQGATSPWPYLVLFALAAVDGFFPVAPGETALVIAAVLAASAGMVLPLVILSGAVGAFVGDHTSYVLGRNSIGLLRSRNRARAAFEWVETRLDERGGMLLLASRFVPGVRTATTMTMGAVAYRLRRFTLVDSVAATLWATGWALLGYVAGASLRNDPLQAVLLGLGLALALTVFAELIRRFQTRRFSRWHVCSSMRSPE